ncbi:unnamed protein product, partial [Ilex paraguariensis]
FTVATTLTAQTFDGLVTPSTRASANWVLSISTIAIIIEIMCRGDLRRNDILRDGGDPK